MQVDLCNGILTFQRSMLHMRLIGDDAHDSQAMGFEAPEGANCIVGTCVRNQSLGDCDIGRSKLLPVR